MKRIVRVLIISLICVNLLSCTKIGITSLFESDNESYFSIRFIDVGQGDSALVECDGHFMLIDGGPQSAGEKVKMTLQQDMEEALKSSGRMTLDYLVVSHLHEDHIGGLPIALGSISEIGMTLCNTSELEYVESLSDVPNDEEIQSSDDEEKEKKAIGALKEILRMKQTQVTVPEIGSVYYLGSATIEIVDVAHSDNNDSLVLMITYKDNEFLFTGDIELNGQKRVYEKYEDYYVKGKSIDVMKMPHHGSYRGSFQGLYKVLEPHYTIISVGAGNRYNHPSADTISFLNSYKNEKAADGDCTYAYYRTDQSGDIIVKSDGTEVSITTSR